jgi:hypothetical protein
MKYDYNTLLDFCKEHNIILCEMDKLNNLNKINYNTIIQGKCVNPSCNFNFKKEFRSLIRSNGYCIECNKINAKNKLKNTWFEKYGVDHISKLDYFKSKVKKTSLEKYGSECSLQNSYVKEKTKKTCLEKYGFEHSSQSEETREKARQTCLEKYGVDHYTKSQDFKEQYKNTCLEKYGTEHSSKLEETKEKARQTCLEKYGVDYYAKSNEFKKQLKDTFLSKYGVDSPFKISEFIEKGKKTCLEKYGVEYYSQTDEIREKTKLTCLEKYGVDHYTKSQEFKNRYKETCLEKYGVENSSQNKEIMDKIIKNAYSLKEYTFPSGRIDKIQGYEHYALHELIINEKISETDIITGCKNVPNIWYIDKNNKKRTHYVDIFIPSQNRCIEIKSKWTEKINLDNIFLKQKAGRELGFNYEIWVYDNKGIRIKKYE